MTPTRMVSICAGILIPTVLYISLHQAKNDLLLRTRSVFGQMRKADPHSKEQFFSALRLPDGDLIQQERVFDVAWSTVRRLEITGTEYGSREKLDTGDGRKLPHGEVIVHGTVGGERRTVRVDWVNADGSWYLHDFRTEVR